MLGLYQNTILRKPFTLSSQEGGKGNVAKTGLELAGPSCKKGRGGGSLLVSVEVWSTGRGSTMFYLGVQRAKYVCINRATDPRRKSLSLPLVSVCRRHDTCGETFLQDVQLAEVTEVTSGQALVAFQRPRVICKSTQVLYWIVSDGIRNKGRT